MAAPARVVAPAVVTLEVVLLIRRQLLLLLAAAVPLDPVVPQLGMAGAWLLWCCLGRLCGFWDECDGIIMLRMGKNAF